ncbi:MAG: bifunctional 2-polyprenyl-6-hydroxyphenol methylase/3-demethylubiquinol 3-O-methyltransferase UbiG [Candidatus Caenarcaniphilales bacterium]|nr:bifunctional 2-polyprenyl-6-hydroxyphenol methylase/3-demethylubiquinol 3-O-methyltransferase UbiG [Candidatus Caenarcaniphilales bacterium]
MVNNDFYNELTLEDWWQRINHAVYFLRAETPIRIDFIKNNFPNLENKKVLDLGSGAGFISIPLAQEGAQVTSVDLSERALELLAQKAGQENCATNIQTVKADITKLEEHYALNIQPQSYDLVLAMDVLEHVKNPEQIVKRAKECLKPGGKFIFHTLNRSFACWLLYLQAMPFLIKHYPKDVHLHEYNIKPQELNEWLKQNDFKLLQLLGIKAPFFQRGMLELIFTSQVKTPLDFVFTDNLSLGYIGLAEL